VGEPRYWKGQRVRIHGRSPWSSARVIPRDPWSVSTYGERVPLPAVGTVLYAIIGAPERLTQLEVVFDGYKDTHVVFGEYRIERLDVISQLAWLL
jgi:hypothetical protein